MNSTIQNPFHEALLRQIGGLADKLGVRVYAVGGFVRDQLLGRKAGEIDFVVLGDGPAFAEKARGRLRGKGLVTFPKFGTASFFAGGMKVEFVTARRELPLTRKMKLCYTNSGLG